LNKKVESLKINCFSCQSPNHLMLDCPLIHYIPNKYIVIRKYLAPVLQDRKAYSQRKNLRYNVRGHLINIQSIAMALIKDRGFNKPDSQFSKESSNSESSEEASLNEKGFEINKAESNKDEMIDEENKKFKEKDLYHKSERRKNILDLKSIENSNLNNFDCFPLRSFEKENYLISAQKIGIGSKKNSKEEDFQKFMQDFKDKNIEEFSESLENMDKMKNFKFYFVKNNFEEIAKRCKKRRVPFKNFSSSISRKQKKK